MAFVELEGTRIHYEMQGSADAPVLIFSNSLGTDLAMWTPQMAHATKRYRVLRYDKRGHGESSRPKGPYTIELLGKDAIGLLDALKIGRAHFCGISIGGQTGLWLGIHAPERLKKLVVSNTGAKIGTTAGWNARIETVRKDGLKAVSSAVIERWFTAKFREKEPTTVEEIRQMLEGQDAEGYAGCCAAVQDFDAREQVKRVKVPTLVMAGTHDTSTPPSEGRFIAGEIAGAKYVELDAAHLSNIEANEKFTDELLRFVAE